VDVVNIYDTTRISMNNIINYPMLASPTLVKAVGCTGPNATISSMNVLLNILKPSEPVTP